MDVLVFKTVPKTQRHEVTDNSKYPIIICIAAHSAIELTISEYYIVYILDFCATIKIPCYFGHILWCTLVID